MSTRTTDARLANLQHWLAYFTGPAVTAGIDGTAWYQLRIHRVLKRRLPDSRSTELLGEALQELLDSPDYRQVVPEGIAPAVWAAGYAKREGKGVPAGAGDPVAQEPIRLAP